MSRWPYFVLRSTKLFRRLPQTIRKRTATDPICSFVADELFWLANLVVFNHAQRDRVKVRGYPPRPSEIASRAYSAAKATEGRRSGFGLLRYVRAHAGQE